MNANIRSAFGLVAVMTLMLISACSDGGGSPVDPPPPPPPPVPQTVTLGATMKDGSAVPSDVTLTLTDRNYSKVIPFKDGKFTINEDSLAPFSDRTVELYFSGAEHRYPSLKRVDVDSLKQNKVKGAVLVNDEKCLKSPEYVGTYEGQCVQISLPLGFDSVTVDNGSTYSYYRHGGRLTLGTLPIKVAISPGLLGDSANIWQGLHEVENFVGIKGMYAPAPYGEVVDSSLIMPGYYMITLHGLLIQQLKSISMGTISDESGRIIGGSLVVTGPAIFRNTGSFLSAMWNTLGPLSTCSWDSIVRGSFCSSYPYRTENPSAEDVAYLLFMYDVRHEQLETGYVFGMEDALNGYVYAKEHNLPRPLLN